jgi:hypothetical protein
MALPYVLFQNEAPQVRATQPSPPAGAGDHDG